MEIKKLTIKECEYSFIYDENQNMWRALENSNLIDGQTIDMEIDLANFNDSFDWQDVEKFIESLKNNNLLYLKRIEDAKAVLKTLFKVINKNGYDKEFFDYLDFNLSGIDFKGYCSNVNLKDKFEYDYFFFPQYSKDPYRDIGSFVWRSNFRDALLLGVSCDRI
ncbi:hypothetical protein [Flavobacterium frigoris]|uniref:Uncharacterized protein n=1 Tax=Flavobacterium frigoris TaxID=229204 RepID=A0A1H9RX19_FLAFI|nr:hypothetical protein [Flavobacterium frigoris]SER77350.1 hypothetical protein SAMN05444355_1274 [Flavobacterium frigoris]